jgi:hypothetical protein
MRNIYITFLFLIFCSMAYAQEQAKYRITYDCDAQVVTGKTNTYRWTHEANEQNAKKLKRYFIRYFFVSLCYLCSSST